MQVRLRPTCLAAVAAGALLAAPGAASASATAATTAARAGTEHSVVTAAEHSALTAAAGRPPALLASASSMTLAAPGQAVAVRRPQSGRGEPQQLPAAGFDGMLVAGVGTGLTVGGWLLVLAGGRRLRRRAGRRG